MAIVTLNEPTAAVQPVSEDDRRQFVIDAVLAKLGRPRDLQRIDARKLWGDNYRVNIFCSNDAHETIRTLRMTDSFFVTLDKQNNLQSQPSIVRKYEAVSLN